ncbi:MAG: ubiquinol-cytochrome C reductase [Nitrospinae bacterium CG11_big_fil_rev_8_21_14_0_20_45_15]|nr:MAG: ubiquinol-cytochrome C reductase [Nitrospinae bacterium CG11_big_fil_rev_8_21_14_0_20_45_15]
MKYWLVKQEPSKYSWEQLVKDKSTLWDGVRNYQARNNLKEMKKGDYVLFYHSVVGKEIKGVARVIREFYPDPTVNDERWVVVDIEAVRAFDHAVTLDEVKVAPQLESIALVKQSRLSVMPLSPVEFKTLLKMGKIKL